MNSGRKRKDHYRGNRSVWYVFLVNISHVRSVYEQGWSIVNIYDVYCDGYVDQKITIRHIDENGEDRLLVEVQKRVQIDLGTAAIIGVRFGF
jgi:hypothetical protein